MKRGSPNVLLVAVGLIASGWCLPVAAADDAPRPKRIAAIVSTYYQNSHADVIVSRLLQTQTLDGRGERLPLQLVSLYTDQVAKNDKSRKLAAEHNVPIYDRVADALTLGTGQLAIDGVLLVCEHGDYPVSETGQTIYPKRRLFEEMATVFRSAGRGVPVFVDKHLADNWQDAKWIYDTARELKFPMMAGSSLPVTWRYPPVDLRRDAPLQQIVVVSYHTLDAYGFHALEAMQTLVERRRGGETGIARVQCLVDEAVWKAGEEQVYDRELLSAALGRLQHPVAESKLREMVPHPVLWVIDYQDGLRANVLTLNNAVGQWSCAWRYSEDRSIDSTLFWTQEERPFMHFGLLLDGINHMMHSGEPTWPVERTLLSSGLLDALLISKRDGGKRLETPWLGISYRSAWQWQEPPAPPAGRPLDGQ